MEADDRKLFAQSLRRATEQHTAAALDAALDELGWHDALEDDRPDAVSILFELQGDAGVTSSALNDLLAYTLGLEPGVTVVLPRLGHRDPAGEIAGSRLRVHGVASGPLREQVAIPGSSGDASADAVIATVATTDLQVRPARGIDPELGLVEVTADLAYSPVAVSPTALWPAAVAAGQLALAHELVGACSAMLRLAREHAVERVQFGRPIAGFQAVRHRLADSLVATEAARACADAAWDAASDAGLAASLAKAVAGASARSVGKHAQQVLGGMGYTTEHPLHRYVRRALVLDQLLGAGRTLTRELGAGLLHARKLPALLPL